MTDSLVETIRRLRQVNARQAEAIDRLSQAERAAVRREGAARRRVRELEAEIQRRRDAA